ncbi:hypothetical protein BTI_1589 [Burkholderia thailandensis MSMB121]|uniref:hypothetical protein n=1 Tax=Burkholderia humptydooensis TaxID=430531 RepID=UPI000327F573|nr:hypothetical protein [Burkholderia humptydooensis]AGK47568.1 hypothetical protein BTI_1589 [Burkholderia thailandensis MSMB121]ATF36667.1 hypothetical protein CO709_27640 [Burkholderia thailandensis]KST74045.1 hypothetical protein WS76_07675 [Burkholderia humptydooensis]
MLSSNSAEALLEVEKRCKAIREETCASATVRSVGLANELAAYATELATTLAREVVTFEGEERYRQHMRAAR